MIIYIYFYSVTIIYLIYYVVALKNKGPVLPDVHIVVNLQWKLNP